MDNQITKLDTTIAVKVELEMEFEEEKSINANTYQLTLEERIAFLTEFVCKAGLLPPTLVSPLPVSPPASAVDTLPLPVLPLTSAVDTLRVVHTSTYQNVADFKDY